MTHFNISELEQRLNSLGEDIHEFVERVVSKTEKGEGFRPPLDVIKDEENLILLMDLPGMEKSDVTISHKNQVLSISGTRKDTSDATTHFLKQERRTGSFTRSFALPADVNSAEIKAAFKQGVLRVTVPLKNEASESDTIIIE